MNNLNDRLAEIRVKSDIPAIWNAKLLWTQHETAAAVFDEALHRCNKDRTALPFCISEIRKELGI